MNLENLINSKQFRGRRARNGKLFRNKVGGYERSRISGSDAEYDTRRREFKLAALERDAKEGLDEALLPQFDYLFGADLLDGGSNFSGDDQSFYDHDLDCSMVVRYGADGKIVSFHMPDDSDGYDDHYFDEGLGFSDDFAAPSHRRRY